MRELHPAPMLCSALHSESGGPVESATGAPIDLHPAQRDLLQRFGAERCVDVHCHLLPGLDDGPADLDASVALAGALVKQGITDVVATPHQLGRHETICTASRIREALDTLRAELTNVRLPLRLHAGADVRIDERLPELIESGAVLTVADAKRFVLLEWSGQFVPEPGEVLTPLMRRGVRVVLTHPERYAQSQRDPGLIDRWKRAGALLQVTSASLLGDFGRRAGELAWALVSQGMCDMMATDAHDVVRRPPRWLEAIDAITARCSHHVARRLMIEAPATLLQNDAD